jgi:2-polyprenyl-3-methyl-5-hydroxy-6-metoxy-1,4-benzoquinol methylase
VGVAEYLLGIVPPGTHDWRKFLEPSEVTQFLQEVRAHFRGAETLYLIGC